MLIRNLSTKYGLYNYTRLQIVKTAKQTIMNGDGTAEVVFLPRTKLYTGDNTQEDHHSYNTGDNCLQF